MQERRKWDQGKRFKGGKKGREKAGQAKVRGEEALGLLKGP